MIKGDGQREREGARETDRGTARARETGRERDRESEKDLKGERHRWRLRERDSRSERLCQARNADRRYTVPPAKRFSNADVVSSFVCSQAVHRL